MTPLLDYRPGSGTHIVCDRWHLGEVVYPRVENRHTRMSVGVFKWIELFLESRGAMTMIINPDLDILQKRLADRGDDLVDGTKLAAIHQQYARFALDESTASYERYVRFQPTVDTVIASARATNNRTTPSWWTTYVGPHVPEVLLVGDVRNCVGGEACTHYRTDRVTVKITDEKIHSANGPAFMPYPATSGHFLMDAVTPKFGHTQFGVANACDTDDILQLWRELHSPKVVALGVQADDKLTELGIPHGTVPHPQFVRRFHFRACRRYGEKIREVADSEENAISWRP